MLTILTAPTERKSAGKECHRTLLRELYTKDMSPATLHYAVAGHDRVLEIRAAHTFQAAADKLPQEVYCIETQPYIRRAVLCVRRVLERVPQRSK